MHATTPGDMLVHVLNRINYSLYKKQFLRIWSHLLKKYLMYQLVLLLFMSVFNLSQTLNHPFSTYAKINMSFSLIHTSRCGYQEVGNVSFSENVAHVLINDPYFKRLKGVFSILSNIFDGNSFLQKFFLYRAPPGGCFF